MDYIELSINCEPREPWADIAVALLAELPFDSFVETETGVLAYIPATSYDKKEVTDLFSTNFNVL